MARKATDESGRSHGFDDIIGVVLLVLALLLLIAQVSFDRYDLAFVRNPPNKPPHNLIGPVGAHMAYVLFFFFGAAAFTLPVLLVVFGVARIPDWLRWLRLAGLADATGHYRERWRSHLLWSVVFLIAVCGLLHMMDS